MEDNPNQNLNSTDLFRKFTSNETKDYIVPNKSKIVLKEKLVNQMITWENLKISALKMLIPFIYHISKLKLFQKQNQINTVTEPANFNKLKILCSLISIDFIYFIIHWNRNFLKNKFFAFKELGKIILKSSLGFLGGIGLSYSIQDTYLISDEPWKFIVELFSMFTCNFVVETLCDKFIGTNSKEEIFGDKIQNSDYAFHQSLYCFRVDQNVDEITLQNIKLELLRVYNPDKFKNEQLKEKARMKIRKYQAAYEIIKTRIFNKTNK